MKLIAPARRSPLLLKALVPVAACAAVAVLLPASNTAAPAETRTVASHPDNLRVASFNVQSVSVDRTQGERRPWRARRGTVIREILGERVDIIGVQEANPSTHFAPRLVDGRNQYLDLRNGLNKAGGHYALANANAVNCVNPDTGFRCRYRYRGASGSERILYDTRSLTRLSTGSMRYSHQAAGFPDAYLAWAWMRSRANGHKLLFTTTHLDPSHPAVRRAQWKQMISKVRRLHGSAPVVSVGDFNTQKFDVMTREMLPAMKNAGFGDVLNQQYRVNPARGVRAQHRVNGWMNSYNHLTRNVAAFGYVGRHDKVGNSIDYVFASNWLRVPEFKMVLNYNPATLRVTGTLPSDHNMVRATITLP